eukprot:scaffold1741_cov262-Pinguiococcus_pyrenoidosus.AAC.32
MPPAPQSLKPSLPAENWQRGAKRNPGVDPGQRLGAAGRSGSHPDLVRGAFPPAALSSLDVLSGARGGKRGNTTETTWPPRALPDPIHTGFAPGALIGHATEADRRRRRVVTRAARREV